MGFETNDDAGMGLPPVMLGSDSTRRLAVIRDEQRMADVFQEAMLAVIAMRAAADGFDAVQSTLSISTRFALATRLESAANALESAIARANGGAA